MVAPLDTIDHNIVAHASRRSLQPLYQQVADAFPQAFSRLAITPRPSPWAMGRWCSRMMTT
jgi:hypothetical protein